MTRVAAAPTIALAIALASAVADGHDLGVSRMNLTERDDGSVHGQFTFAARDAEAAFDRDGHVAVDVRADGESCAPGPATITPQGDGMQIDEDFTCAEKATRSLEAIAYFVTQIGGSHEDVAILETPEGTHEELLRPSHRAIAVALRRPRRESPHRWVPVAVACAAIVALALLAFGIRSILRRRS